MPAFVSSTTAAGTLRRSSHVDDNGIRMKSLPRLLAAAAFAAFTLSSLGAARAEPPAAVPAADADFLAAKAMFDRGEARKLDAIATRLSGHPLAIYVDYWRMWLKLPAASQDEVRAFLARAAGTPLADMLRIEWLRTVGRRGQWDAFGADYAEASGGDTELACLAVQYRRQREGDDALAAARPLWFTGQSTPDACEPLFAALVARGDLGVADRLARLRLATEAGNTRLAQAIAADLPPDERITVRDFAAVDRDPARALARGEFRWKYASGHTLALYALERAARSDAVGARSAWLKVRARLSDADRLYGNARIAYHAARQLVPQANDWYREASGAPLSDAAHAWRARAALRASAWNDVVQAIDAMPPKLALDATWRYWKARAYAVSGQADDATLLFAGLADEPTFYGLLAAEALGKREPAPTVAPGRPAEAALAAFGARSDVARAVKLAELGLRPEAQREWLAIVRGRADDELLVAAEYARRRGLYDRAINTAERTSASHDFALRYLTPYREHFDAAAREQSVDAALLFGIARQESRFAQDIVSSAGAVGLMQLMPPTARWVAKQLGRSDYNGANIGDPHINTQFGAFYFKYWLDRLDGSAALAAAAYNAGPNRARAWRVGAPVEGAVWVETIPFNETRDYVKKVLANSVFYARELKQPHVPLSRLLGVVSARDGNGGNGSAANGGGGSGASGS
jgi:soluble lytic murein transglycosylase